MAIIVPVSLVAQWLAEIKTFLGSTSPVEVYVFPPAAADWPKFWAPTANWNTSLQPMHLRIIIFQHSVRGTTCNLSHRVEN